MKNWADIWKNITLLTQFGLSFITPLFICLGVCWWLSVHMGVGGWVFIPGFFFGMGGSGMVAYKFYLSVTARDKKDRKKPKVFFNKHS
ncbi:AtpZ/AtpI family protein [Blautia sp. HCP3S3_G3]|uniref:AtpZ/AtpI family protein n=1 Tax=Blautia sp. HCP3S3_G3 TaxID=3438913 RepID=UPI003F8CC5A1